MTDHADTIRRTLSFLPTKMRLDGDTEWIGKGHVEAALDALLAELQQAQQEVEKFRHLWRAAEGENRTLHTERQQAQETCDAAKQIALRYEDQLWQAIDALREITQIETGTLVLAKSKARKALLSLGEQP